MSTPASPVISQGGTIPFVQQTATPSVASSSSEHQISYKKPVRIKNDLNEKRRNALKEYYKLQKQQKKLEEAQSTRDRKDSVQDIDSDGEISADQSIKEIDLMNSEFKDLVKDTNKITSSINLINSSIKNIIYNNYYELIKLNDFLKDLNELDLSKLIVQDQDGKAQKNDALNLLNATTLDNASVKSIKFEDFEGDGFTKLKALMNEIEDLDKTNVTRNAKTPDHTTATNITSYLQIEKKEDVKDVKDAIKTNIERLLPKIKDQDHKEALIRQLEEIQKKLK